MVHGDSPYRSPYYSFIYFFFFVNRDELSTVYFLKQKYMTWGISNNYIRKYFLCQVANLSILPVIHYILRGR